MLKKVVFLLLLLSCASHRFTPVYQSFHSWNPMVSVDSLSRVYGITVTPYTGWFANKMVTSDSIYATVYTSSFTVKDTVFVISLTEFSSKQPSIINFRKEFKAVK